jgi:hypothetical protein
MADPYDASETDERPRSAHVSRKDWKILIVFTILVSPILWLFFMSQREIANSAVCDQNLAQIQKAIGVYSENNNGRFPPAFVETPDHQPMMIRAGKVEAPVTWITQIQAGFESRASFVCPSSSSVEYATNLHQTEKDITTKSTYGMYLPRSGWPESLIQNPEQAVLIAETSNRGSNDTFDPKPFDLAPDGCVIGWDSGNQEMSEAARFVTRLAFPGSKNGNFPNLGRARHDTNIHILFANGRRGRITTGDAKIERLGGQSAGYWADR